MSDYGEIGVQISMLLFGQSEVYILEILISYDNSDSNSSNLQYNTDIVCVTVYALDNHWSGRGARRCTRHGHAITGYADTGLAVYH